MNSASDFQNQYEMVKCMLLGGKVCPVSFKDFDGNTSLHFASSRGFYEGMPYYSDSLSAVKVYVTKVSLNTDTAQCKI